MSKEHFPYIAIVGVVAVVAVVVLLLSLRTAVQAPVAPVAEEGVEESAEAVIAGEALKIGGKLTQGTGIISTATKSKIKKPSTELGACGNNADDDGDGLKDWDDTDCKGSSCSKADGTSGVVVWSYTDRSEPSLLGIGCCDPTDCVNSIYCTKQGGVSTPEVPQLFCASKNLWTFCEDAIVNQASEDGKYTCTLTSAGDYLWSSTTG
ncbi:MAG: hypothetical protein AABX13_02360 [Nanoarchaeota archaeon]